MLLELDTLSNLDINAWMGTSRAGNRNVITYEESSWTGEPSRFPTYFKLKT